MEAKTVISSEFPFESKFVQVLGNKLHYVEEGTGDPILFLHGNPTSTYLWRNIIPYLSSMGRCIAVDNIGMGKSDKPDIAYGFKDTYEYLEGFIETLGLKNIMLILHDWGSGLGFHYANTHRNNIKAIACMESIVDAIPYDDLEVPVKIAFWMMRHPILGGFIVQQMNIWFKFILQDNINRKLTQEEMKYYTDPYPTPASRLPLAAWPKDVPFS